MRSFFILTITMALLAIASQIVWAVFSTASLLNFTEAMAIVSFAALLAIFALALVSSWLRSILHQKN